MNVHLINYSGVLSSAYGLVLTANAIEKAAVEKVLATKAKADLQRRTQGATLGFVDPHIVLHLTGRAGGTDEDAVGRLVRHMLTPPMPRPSFVVLVGFGWGSPSRTNVGDVMLADDVYMLNHRRATRDGSVYTRTTSRNVLRVPDGVSAALAANANGFMVHHGPLASLETHFASDLERDELLAQFPDLIGGEMEAYSFLPDCATVPWVVMKAVSDFGGYATDRVNQERAAANAAQLLPMLIRLLTRDGELPEAENDDAGRQSLIDGIIGDTLVVSMPNNPNRLNDYLNDDVGPLLDRHLARYESDVGSGDGLRRSLTNLILESVQNALRHGGASRAEIAFFETKVVLHDDGGAFDLESLAGEKGGALAWRQFKERYLDPGDTSINYKRSNKNGRNICEIKFETLSVELRAARDRCSVSIVPDVINSWPAQGVFIYDPACEVIHVSVGDVRMFSRSLEIVRAIISELEKVKRFTYNVEQMTTPACTALG